MKNKKLLLTSILGMSIAALVGCGPNNPSEQASIVPSIESATPSEQDSPIASESESIIEVDEELPYEKGNRFDYTGTKIHRFDYNGVKLSNDSKFKKEFDYAMDYLLTIPTDDFLKIMRQREDMDVEGSRYLGGWYDGGLWVAATFGQYVSSLARAYALTNDVRYKEKATELLDGWAETISDDGFFYFSPDRGDNSTHYTYDKVVLMCLDCYLFIGGDLGTRALKYLKRCTEFTKTYFLTARKPATPNGPDSGQSVNGGASDIEWYTISENLYRCYLATGDEYYLDYADFWNYDYFWDALRNGQGEKYYNVHAYSHTNSIGGSALRYMIYGEEENLETLIGAYNMYQDYECYPNGMYGSAERLLGGVVDRNSAIERNVADCETPCNTWAIIKLIKSLTEITADPKYQEWNEKALYNGILSTLRLKDDSVRRGITFYYANYQKNAIKEYYGASWPCCSGTYFLNLCDVADQLYYKDDDSLYVANYVSSKVTNNYNKRNVTLETEADMPNSDVVRMKINCTNKVDFNLKLRVPSWSKNYVLKVNGTQVNGTRDSNGWLIAGTSFRNGDVIEISFERELTLEQVEPNDDYGAMAMYGSVYYVALNAESTVFNIENGKKVSDYIVGTNGNVFYIRDAEDTLFEFVPFFSLSEGDTYAGNVSIKRVNGGK